MDGDSEFRFNGANQLMGLWWDLASNMTRAMMAVSPQQTPPEAFRQIRSAQLGAWGEYVQQLMRTPEFLDVMKQWTTASVQFRKQWSDFFGQLQHEFQGASRQDVDQLMLSMRHLERRIVEGVEQVSIQLEDLESRMASLERLHERNGHTGSEGERERRKKKRKRRPSTRETTE
jgi:hypothetical protein